ncbi:MAG: repeat-associated core domain protein [Rhodocyclales bacterium]|nr:repeat-associated core domain protein [Rhodocyclales bacterium]
MRSVMLRAAQACLLATVILSNCFAAAPQDVAPMSDEVLSVLPGLRPVMTHPLVAQLEVRRASLNSVLAKDTGAQRSAGVQGALNAELHALRAMKATVTQTPGVTAEVKTAVGVRLDEVSALLESLIKSSPNQRQQALADLRAWMVAYWKAEENTSSLSALADGPGGNAPKRPSPPALPISDKKPEYVLQQEAFDGLAMFGGGPAGMMSMLLPSLPGKSYCDFKDDDVSYFDGINVVNNAELVELAKQLEYSPAKILEWVNKEITYEPYFGARKGAMGALYTKAGGPTDIASLTISLFRISNIPARYVKGAISLSAAQIIGPDSQLSRWLGTRSATASYNLLYGAQIPGLTSSSSSIQFNHVWIEACVPYAHYRGSRIDVAGSRWIALDPSFRSPDYVGGAAKADASTFDYGSYLGKRTTLLPLEHFEDLVRAQLATNGTGKSINDLPYTMAPIQAKLDVLPSSLPYSVIGYSNWQNSGSPSAATLPPQHVLQLNVTVRKNPTDSILSAQLPMPEIGAQRVSLLFKDASGAAVSNWLADGQATSGAGSTIAPCSASVVPSLRVGGVERAVGNIPVTYCSQGNQLQLELTLEDMGAANRQVNYVLFKAVNANNLTSILSYTQQVSSRHIQERAAQLLADVRSPVSGTTFDRLDAVEGEFLNIVGLKFNKHVQDDTVRLSQLTGAIGILASNLGAVSTQAKVDSVFDQPFGISRTGYLIDVPGGLFSTMDRDTGRDIPALQRLLLYMSSSYESYVWQENARTDAVSTVRGLQYASEKGIPILEFDAATQSCSNLQDSLTPISTAREQLGIYCYAHGAGASLDSFNACMDFEAKRQNLAYNSLGYSFTAQSNICKNYFYSGSNAKLKIPKSLINYNDDNSWIGYVFAAEFPEATIGTTTTPFRMGMVISSETAAHGGWSVAAPIPYVYSPKFNSGWLPSSPQNFVMASGANTAPSAIWSPSVNLGRSNYVMLLADPVNPVNGNLYQSTTDISIKGRGDASLVFTRSYNSRDVQDGPLGFGWTHTFNQFLEFSDDNPDQKSLPDDTDGAVSSIIWYDATGARKSIASSSDGRSFTTPDGFYFTVSRAPDDDRYKITEKNGTKYYFESKAPTLTAGYRAKLLRIEDRNNNALQLYYDAAGNLLTVTDGLGRSLGFSYSGTPYKDSLKRITAISDWTGRRWNYGYDANGDLVQVSDPITASRKTPGTRYRYYTLTDGQNFAHAMASYTAPRGDGMTYEYYVNGRMFRHYNTRRPNEATSFSYNDFRRETVVTDEKGRNKHYLFNRFGNLDRVIEADGGITSYKYDCPSIEDPTLTACPNPYNRISMTNALGHTTYYAYDGQGNVVLTTLPSGKTVQTDGYAANTFGRPRRVKDARDNWAFSRFDSKGNVTDQIVLKALVVPTGCPATECDIPVATSISSWSHLEYDSWGNAVQVKRMRDFAAQTGPIVTINFDDPVNGSGLNPVKIARVGDTNGDGVINSSDRIDEGNFTFDSLGRMKDGVDGALYPVKVSQYDVLGRPVVSVDAVGRTIERDYDDNGNLIAQRVKGNDGNLWDTSRFAYDDYDRLLSATNNQNLSTTYEYDAVGNRVATTGPDGYRVEAEYDSVNRLLRAWDAEGNLTRRDYDVAGRIERLVDARGIAVTTDYYGPERDGRLKRVTQPAIQGESAGRAIEQEYDDAGNATATIAIGSDAATRKQLSFYDEQGRVVRSVGPTDSAGNRLQTCYQYSTLGYLTNVYAGPSTNTSLPACNFSDATLIRQVTYVYDDFGHKLREIDQLNRAWVWAYDNHGNVQTAKDPKNQTTAYTWLSGGRADTRTDAGNHLTSWTYFPSGELKTVADSNVTYTYAYDTAHRVASVKDSRGNKTLAYAYTPGGLLNRMTDGENRAIDYRYDAVGRLTGMFLPSNDYVGYSYDQAGNLAEKWSPIGVRSQYSFNADGSLASIRNLTDNTREVSSHGYTYDAFGARKTLSQRLNGVQTDARYTYDDMGRLTAAYLKPVGGPESRYRAYTYDVFGNFDRQTYQDDAYDKYVFDNTAHQLKQIDRYNGSTLQSSIGFTYDDNGNLTNKTTPGASLTLGWDELNRLANVVSSGAGAVTQSYQYDAQGRRIRKSSGAIVTDYLYNGDDIHAEYSSWAQPGAIYVHGEGFDNQVARLPLVGGVLQPTRYFHTDALGSVVAATDVSTSGSDAVANTAAYDPFGAAQSGSLPNGYSFTGRERDETGLMYYRARYYDSNIGRFVARDPIGLEGGINPYAYVGNAPLDARDPTGNIAFWDNVLGGAIGGVMDIGVQYVTRDKAKPFSPNWTRAGAAAVIGFATSGVSAFAGTAIASTGARIGAGMVTQAVVRTGANAVIGAAGGAASTQINNTYFGTHDDVWSAAKFGAAGGVAGSVVGDFVTAAASKLSNNAVKKIFNSLSVADQNILQSIGDWSGTNWFRAPGWSVTLGVGAGNAVGGLSSFVGGDEPAATNSVTKYPGK